MDFAQDPPGATSLPGPQKIRDKRGGIDTFAVGGNTLYAVDNIVQPLYVLAYELGSLREPGFYRMLELSVPGYGEARVVSAAASEGRLFVHLRTFDRIGPAGDPWALVQRGNGLAVRETSPSHRPPYSAYLSESTGWTSRSRKDAPRLLAGAAYTDWQKLASHGPRLFLAAGTRGVIALEARARGFSPARHIETGGNCISVVVRGDRLFALNEGSLVAFSIRQGEVSGPRAGPELKESAGGAGGGFLLKLLARLELKGKAKDLW